MLMWGFAALVDIALSDFSPGANVPGSAVGTALALVEALDRSPAPRLDVELVLAGAGEGPALGMRAYVRARRRRQPEETAVLAIEPCGVGTPCWVTRDGQLFPLRYHPRLIELCQRAAGADPSLGAPPFASHGMAQAFPARIARWPAIAVGCRDERDQVPGAHEAWDVADRLDARSMEAALELCLALVGRLSDDLEQRLGPGDRQEGERQPGDPQGAAPRAVDRHKRAADREQAPARGEASPRNRVK
jgi:hypothetical protein